MKKTAKKKSPTADEIAELAMKGDNVSKFFTNEGEMRPPIQRVNVDFTLDMLNELDDIAKKMNVSRQAVIKSYLRQALDQHYLAKQRQALSRHGVSACVSAPIFSCEEQEDECGTSYK